MDKAGMTPNGEPLRFLAIDDQALPLRKNVCLYLSKPKIRAEAVLAPSPLESKAPDNSATHFYGTVLHDAGKFRMWYYACHFGKNPDWPPRLMQQIAKSSPYVSYQSQLFQGPLCYAESDDGIHWTKPALGQVLFKGSRANNALALPHNAVSGAAVIKDETDSDPAGRYKMVYQYFPNQTEPAIEEYGTEPTIALAVSPDGVQWKPAGIPFRNQFVEHCSFIKHAGAYIIHFHAMHGLSGYYSEGGAFCGRSGVARVSYDFDHWPDVLSETFALPEPRDPQQRNAWEGKYDQVHLGVGAASFGNVCVGLYGLWHNAKSFADISGDLGLLISNDGLHFREPAKGHIFIHRDESPPAPVPGQNFNTILTQGNGLLNVGDTTYIYHGRWRNAGNTAADDHLYRAEVALATLPRDRWGALGLVPKEESGTICSAPIALPKNGGAIKINAEGAEGISIELLDERLQPISGFSGAQAAKLAGSGGLDCRVNWPTPLSKLRNQAVRVQIHLQRRGEINPRLYAFYMAEE